MVATALVTYLHFAGIIVLFASLIIEAVLFKRHIAIPSARIIGRADAYFGIASVVILATGLLKMFLYGKGTMYYTHNVLLWSKLGLFTVVGLMSIYPTVYFIRWRKKLSDNDGILVPEKEYRLISRLIWLELSIAASIPLLAVFMARGFGTF